MSHIVLDRHWFLPVFVLLFSPFAHIQSPYSSFSSKLLTQHAITSWNIYLRSKNRLILSTPNGSFQWEWKLQRLQKWCSCKCIESQILLKPFEMVSMEIWHSSLFSYAPFAVNETEPLKIEETRKQTFLLIVAVRCGCENDPINDMQNHFERLFWSVKNGTNTNVVDISSDWCCYICFHRYYCSIRW